MTKKNVWWLCADGKVNRVIDVTVYRCDWCDEIIVFDFFHPRPCSICGRYACKEHRDDWKIKYEGDTEIPTCKECLIIGSPYIEMIEAHEEAIDTNIQQWHNKARKAAKECSG